MAPLQHMPVLFVVVCFVMAISLSEQKEVPYCTVENPVEGEPTRPTMDYSYSTQLIGRWVVDKQMEYLYEYVDREKGKIALTDVLGGNRYFDIHNLKTNSSILIGGMSASCIVYKNDDLLQKAKNKGLTALEILNDFGDVWKYQTTTTTIRGVDVQEWRSCNNQRDYIDFVAHFYFTKDKLPFRLELKGVIKHQDGTTDDYHVIYDYFLFTKASPPSQVFEIPPGYVCENVTKVKTPPIVMSASFRMEVVDPIKKQVSYQYVYFDKQRNMSMVQDGNTTTIHDYTRGIQYEMNRVTNECSQKALTRFVGEDQTVDSKGIIHMATLRHFLFDDGTFTQNGVRKARGISCDVYTKTSNAAEELGVSIVEIFIARPSVKITNNEGSVIDSLQQPVRVVLKGGKDEQNLVVKRKYDIYDFDPQENPIYNPFHLDSCFGNKRTIDFSMMFGGQADASRWEWRYTFMATTAKEISDVLGISLLRVRLQDVTTGEGQTKVIGSLFGAEPDADMFQTVPNMKVIKKLEPRYIHTYRNHSNTPALCSDYCVDTNMKPLSSYYYCYGFQFDRSNQDCTFYFSSIYDKSKLDENLLYVNHIDFYRRTYSYNDKVIYLDEAWRMLRYDVEQGLINCTDSNGSVLKATSVTRKYKSEDSSRYYGEDNPLSQFQNITGVIRTIPAETISKMGFVACARHCLNSLKYNCEAFKYVYGQSKCSFYDSNSYRESYSQDSKTPTQITYVRFYSSNFEKIPGRSMLSPDTDPVYTDLKDSNACAELCMKEEEFFCQSFEMCGHTCLIGRNHIYSTPATSMKEDYNCSHFSRNYIQDYSKATNKKALGDSNVIEISNIGAKKCASLCSTSSSYDCNLFEFCESVSLCRMTTKPVQNYDSLNYQSTDNCDLYSRKTGRQRFVNSYSKLTSTSSGGDHTPGSMAGIAIGMIILGIVLMAVVAMVILKLRSPGGNSGMSVGFSRQQMDDDH